MLIIDGSELSSVSTRPRMPYNEFSVRSGRKIRMTRMALTLNLAADMENQPRITTEKSSYIKHTNILDNTFQNDPEYAKLETSTNN